MIARVSNQSQTSGAPTRILFVGTPDFAVTAFQALINLSLISAKSECTREQTTLLPRARGRVARCLEETATPGGIVVVGAVTQPDRPMGREQKLIPSPVKIFAVQHDIPVFQPEKLRDPRTIQTIRDLKPDLIVVVAYGQIIPKEILKIPKYGAINEHGSLLPKYRGASPIQAAIAAGEKETGITIMLMDEQMDHGSILARQSVTIAPDETGESLFKKLAPLGADLLVETISGWVNGTVKSQEQNHSTATYCKLLKREDGKIDWNESAEDIERKIRAYTPWPGTWTTWNGKRLNILKARLVSHTSLKDGLKNSNLSVMAPGAVFQTKNGFAVQCDQSTAPPLLEILELQLEGKKSMSAFDFLHGHLEIIGSTMG